VLRVSAEEEDYKRALWNEYRRLDEDGRKVILKAILEKEA